MSKICDNLDALSSEVLELVYHGAIYQYEQVLKNLNGAYDHIGFENGAQEARRLLDLKNAAICELSRRKIYPYYIGY